MANSDRFVLGCSVLGRCLDKFTANYSIPNTLETSYDSLIVPNLSSYWASASWRSLRNAFA